MKKRFKERLRRLRLSRRVLVLERQFAAIADGLIICDGCGTIMQRESKHVRMLQANETEVKPYCRWCYQPAAAAKLLEHRRPAQARRN